MKFINPKVEYWPQEAGIKGVWKQIARATRVCYQSVQKKEETDEEFVRRVIFKPALIEGNLNDLEHCKFNFEVMHGAMLEHGTVYLRIPYDEEVNLINTPHSEKEDYITPFQRIYFSSYTKTERDIESWLVTTNMRYIIESQQLYLVKRYLCKPTECHAKRYTFNVISDIGVSREGNRHRANSTAEESSRCNAYDKGKYGSELTFAKPSWYNDKDLFLEGAYADKHDGFKTLFHDMITDIKDGSYKQWKANKYYMFGLLSSEFAYMGMREEGEVAQKCRQVLNLNTKTNVVWTAFKEDWIHFLKLRSSEAVSGQPHPNIKVIADMIKQQMIDNKLL